jgi:hypothetical protein
MNYRDFVKENFHKLSADMKAKDKMKKIAEMWRMHNVKTQMPKKVKGGRVVGGGLLDDVNDGMEIASAALPLVSSLFPHTETTIQQATVPIPNLTPAQKTKFLKRMQVGRGGKMNKKDKGGNFFSENILPAMSFGLLGGEVKPKMEGKGMFSDVLASFGLGMEPKILHKHHNRMMMLEKKLHETGKLTPSEHHKLKVYHHLHGAGFFDSLFGGIKKGVSAVVNNLDSIKKVVPEIIKVIPSGVKDRALGLIPGALGTMARAANTLASA